MAEPCRHVEPIDLCAPSSAATQTLSQRRIDEEVERISQEFFHLEIDREEVDKLVQDFVVLWPNPDIPVNQVPRELWTYIFLQLPVPTIIRVARTCKYFFNIVKGEHSLKLTICVHRIYVQRKKWEELFVDKDAHSVQHQKRSFEPLQFPLPSLQTQAEVDEHLRLLDRSNNFMKEEICQRRCFTWCFIPFCVVPTILTCGCGGLCCLGCGILALKNKIVTGTCSLAPF